MRRRALLSAGFILVSTLAFALPTSLKKGLKLGTGCIGFVSFVAPKLAICPVGDKKARIWCANGDIFDVDEERSQVSLLRSLCNLSQLP
jgi:hypothetical protein